MDAITDNLTITIHESSEDAPHWRRDFPEVKGVQITNAMIVRKGMESGNDTVDLVLIDGEGNHYVPMVTARILKGVTDLCITDQ